MKEKKNLYQSFFHPSSFILPPCFSRQCSLYTQALQLHKPSRRVCEPRGWTDAAARALVNRRAGRSGASDVSALVLLL